MLVEDHGANIVLSGGCAIAIWRGTPLPLDSRRGTQVEAKGCGIWTGFAIRELDWLPL